MRRLQDEATQLEKRLCDIEDKFIDGDIDKDTFNRMKTRTEKEIATIQRKIDTVQSSKKNLAPQLNYSFSLLSNIDRVLLEAPVETKVKMLGSMFPEKIEFDGTEYRTTSYNKVLDLIYQDTNTLQGKRNKKSEEVSASSHSVLRPGIEPGSTL